MQIKAVAKDVSLTLPDGGKWKGDIEYPIAGISIQWPGYIATSGMLQSPDRIEISRLSIEGIEWPNFPQRWRN